MRIVRNAQGVIVNAAVLTADVVLHERVSCPACADKDFVDWPVGWDGHAKVCAGVSASDELGRVAEFRTAVAHLIR